jgi:ubiquitin C-terminal hydrolase
MYSKDYSEIWNIFYGIHVSRLIEVETSKVMSMTPEPFFIINLPIPQNNKSPSLLDCFDLYVEGEILDGDNSVLNETTGKKVAAQKNLTFWSLPTILVIDIKRYNVSNRKNQILIDFPLTDLNLSKYVIGYNKETYIYDLYGVCNHGGSVLGGHYTSYVKNSNDKWYHYNDTSVTEVIQPQVQQIISSKAYCFFYRKRAIK